jgi:hypothetical protein
MASGIAWGWFEVHFKLLNVFNAKAIVDRFFNVAMT